MNYNTPSIQGGNQPAGGGVSALKSMTGKGHSAMGRYTGPNARPAGQRGGGRSWLRRSRNRGNAQGRGRGGSMRGPVGMPMPGGVGPGPMTMGMPQNSRYAQEPWGLRDDQQTQPGNGNQDALRRWIDNQRRSRF